jgi:hypothetical protein
MRVKKRSAEPSDGSFTRKFVVPLDDDDNDDDDDDDDNNNNNNNNKRG